MANSYQMTNNTTANPQRWELEYIADHAGETVATLQTGGTFVDRNIRVSTMIPSATVNVTSDVVVAGTITPKVLISSTSAYGFTTTQPSGVQNTNYVLIDPSADVTTKWKAQGSATVSQSGWISNGTINNTTDYEGTPTIAAGTNYYVPIVNPTFEGGTWSTNTNSNTVTTAPVVTVSGSGTFLTQSGFGVTTTKPSGTDGSDYLTVDSSGSVTTTGVATSSWKVTKAAITYNNSAGVIESHSGTQAVASSTREGSQTANITPTVTDNFAARYIPIVKTVTVNGGGLSGSTTTSINVGGMATTTSTTDYYIDASATGTITRAAVTYSNAAGAISAHSTAAPTNNLGTGSINAGSSADRVYIQEAAITGSGTASATTTVAPGTVSIAANSTAINGKTRIAITPQTSNSISTAYYIAALATAAANSTGTTSNITGTATATVSTPGYAPSALSGSGSVTGTATAKTSAKNSDVYYFPVPAVAGSIGGSAASGSATAVLTNTNNIATITSISGKTAGTDYWAIKATATTTGGTYTPKYTVTTAGWLASTVTGSAQAVNVTADSTGKTIYIPRATFTINGNAVSVNTAGYIPANTEITSISGTTITTSYTNSNMSTYFNTGSSSSYSVSIVPKYTATAGYTAAVTTATNNGGTGYWSIKTTSVTQGTTTVSGDTATRGVASWGTGWITGSNIPAASFSNSATSGVTYVDISATTAAPILVSGNYLYINKGYTDNLKISLAKLVPDGASAGLAAGHILSGYSAYNSDGTLIAGNIPTKASSDVTVSGRTVTIPAGYYASAVSKSIGVGTVTSGSATISSVTYTYDSTNDVFLVAGSANVSAPAVNTAGYISSSEGTRNANNGGATVNTTVSKVGVQATITGTATVTPSISKVTTASGNSATNITAQVSNATTSKPTTGYYVAVQSAAGSNTITATPTVSSPGYGTTSYYDSTAATLDVGAAASAVTYLPVTAGSCTVAGGVLSTSGYSKTNLALTLSSGSSTNMSNITVGSQDTTNYPYYFKVNGSTPAVSGNTSASVTAITDTHTAGYISAKATSNFRNAQSASPSVSVNATSASTYVSLKKATMTVAGTNTVTPSASMSGTNVTLNDTDNGIKIIATGGGTASVTATATTNAAGYAPAGTQLGSATLSSNNTTTTATKYISRVDVPVGKTFIAQTTSNSSGTMPTSSEMSWTNSTNRYIQLLNYGRADVWSMGDGSGIIWVTAKVASTDGSLTGNTIVENGIWKTTTVTPNPTTASSAYYGRVIVNPMSSGTQAVGSMSISNGGAVTPTLTKQSVGGSRTDASNGSATTSPSSTGVYVAIKSDANTKTLTAGINVTTAGYVGTASPWKSTTSTVGANASSTYYIPIKTASVSLTGGAISGSVSSAGTNATLSDTDNGIYVNSTATATRANVTYNGAISGWVTATSGAVAFSSGSTALTAAKKFISGVKLAPPSSGTRSFTITIPNGNTTDFIDFVFTVDSSGNVTIEGPN